MSTVKSTNKAGAYNISSSKYEKIQYRLDEIKDAENDDDLCQTRIKYPYCFWYRDINTNNIEIDVALSYPLKKK